ncbi:MAG TPA: hypothetical protein VL997_12065 [Dyella sp.]|nr:hypothetical protein [Dyella sp.]
MAVERSARHPTQEPVIADLMPAQDFRTVQGIGDTPDGNAMSNGRVSRGFVMHTCNAIFLGVVCFALFACSRGDPYFFLNPQLPVSVPFAMDKAGNKAVIDFWAVPGNADLSKTYMVSFSFDRHGSHDPMVLFMSDKPALRPKVRIHLWLIKNQNQQSVPLKDRSLILATGDTARPQVIGNDIAYVYLTAWTGDFADMLVASFDLNEYGHYRAEIEALQDTPALHGLRSELSVTEVFNPGE